MGFPFYILDINKVKINFKNFKNCITNIFNSNKIIFAYSFKTNNYKKIIYEANKQKYWAEVVSLLEMKVAKNNNFEGIIFNSPAKNIKEIEFAIKNKINFISCEHLNEIYLINKIAKKYDLKINILLRIDTQVFYENSNYLIYLFFKKLRRKKTKFGFKLNELNGVIYKIDKLENIVFKGVQLHIGSQINFSEIYVEAFNRIPKKVLEKAEYINFGGGYPVNFLKRKEKKYLFFLNFFKSQITTFNFFYKIKDNLSNKIKNKKLIFEPGRIIVSDAMDAVFKIIRISENRIYLNGGLNLIPQHLFPFNYKIIHIKKFNNTNKIENYLKYDLYGNLCFENDCIAKKIKLNNPCEQDKIIFKNVGAYSNSLNFNFNQKKPFIKLKNE